MPLTPHSRSVSCQTVPSPKGPAEDVEVTHSFIPRAQDAAALSRLTQGLKEALAQLPASPPTTHSAPTHPTSPPTPVTTAPHSYLPAAAPTTPGACAAISLLSESENESLPCLPELRGPSEPVPLPPVPQLPAPLPPAPQPPSPLLDKRTSACSAVAMTSELGSLPSPHGISRDVGSRGPRQGLCGPQPRPATELGLALGPCDPLSPDAMSCVQLTIARVDSLCPTVFAGLSKSSNSGAADGLAAQFLDPDSAGDDSAPPAADCATGSTEALTLAEPESPSGPGLAFAFECVSDTRGLVQQVLSLDRNEVSGYESQLSGASRLEAADEQETGDAAHKQLVPPEVRSARAEPCSTDYGLGGAQSGADDEPLRAATHLATLGGSDMPPRDSWGPTANLPCDTAPDLPSCNTGQGDLGEVIDLDPDATGDSESHARTEGKCGEVRAGSSTVLPDNMVAMIEATVKTLGYGLDAHTPPRPLGHQAHCLSHIKCSPGSLEAVGRAPAPPAPAPRLACRVCKSLVPLSDMMEHEARHAMATPYPCGRCHAMFPDAAELEAHVRQPHNRLFLCRLCLEMFASRALLRTHPCHLVAAASLLPRPTSLPEVLEVRGPVARCRACWCCLPARTAQLHMQQHCAGLPACARCLLPTPSARHSCRGPRLTCFTCGREWRGHQALLKHVCRPAVKAARRAVMLHWSPTVALRKLPLQL